MAVTDAYADAAAYKLRTDKTDSADDTVIDLQLLAISRMLDEVAGRFFTRDTGVIPRTYFPPPYAPNARLLRTHDIATKSGLTITVDEGNDGSFVGDPAFASTDFELLPMNADLGPLAKPWTMIMLPQWGARQFWSPGRRIQVQASWGWPAIPQGIIEATIDATAKLRLETPRATQTIDSMGNLEKVSPDAASIVWRAGLVHRRMDFF